jgi:hypothetical protein
VVFLEDPAPDFFQLATIPAENGRNHYIRELEEGTRNFDFTPHASFTLFHKYLLPLICSNNIYGNKAAFLRWSANGDETMSSI